MLGGLQGLNMSLQYNAKFQQKVPQFKSNGKPLLDKNGNQVYKWIFPIVSTPMGGVRGTNLMMLKNEKDLNRNYLGMYERLYQSSVKRWNQT